MISISFSPLFFHILLCSTFATKIKVLQLSETIMNLCEDRSFDLKPCKNLINFARNNKPNVILWFMKFRRDNTYFLKFNHTVQSYATILPVYRFSDSKYKCINSYDCNFAYTISPLNISFIVLNTGLWLNGFHGNSSETQIEWLKNRLIESRKKQKKVIIVGYDAPGSLETSNGLTKYSTNFNNALLELFQMFSATISQCIFGGERIDSFRIIIKNGHPVIPIFLFPTNDSPDIRIYNFNNLTFTTDNYTHFHRNLNSKGEYNVSYYSKSVMVEQLFQFTKSFSINVKVNFRHYYNFQLKNVSFSQFCDDNIGNCTACCSTCFILHLSISNLTNCLSHCNTIKMAIGLSNDTKNSAKNNNAFYVLGVIIGFVVILLGIVLAVNKTYCIRRNHQRSVFLTPLTLDIHADLHDDDVTSIINGKVSVSNADAVNNHAKSLNGHRRSHYEIEQTYDYIRM